MIETRPEHSPVAIVAGGPIGLAGAIELLVFDFAGELEGPVQR